MENDIISVKTIKQNNQVTVTDITTMARETVPNMCSYDKKAYEKKAYEKKAFLRERKWYWMDLGKSETEALELAGLDVEFAYD